MNKIITPADTEVSGLLREWQSYDGTLADLADQLGVTRQTLHNYSRRDTLDRALETVEIFEKLKALVATRKAAPAEEQTSNKIRRSYKRAAAKMPAKAPTGSTGITA